MKYIYAHTLYMLYICMHTQALHTRVCTYIYTHLYGSGYTHVHMHIHTQSMGIYTHTYTHTLYFILPDDHLFKNKFPISLANWKFLKHRRKILNNISRQKTMANHFIQRNLSKDDTFHCIVIISFVFPCLFEEK